MSQQNLIPCLPENAPFTPEQRAYLNGFLAGLYSRMPAPAADSSQPAQPLTALSILFGSQTGSAENLAKRLAKEAGKRGFAPTIHDLAKYPVAQLAAEEHLLIISSTYGDGEPPDNARSFWNFLSGATAPKLSKTRFSVCAIGDSNYPKFCGFGKDLDARLESLGGQRVHPRVDCDLDYEEPFAKWFNETLTALNGAVASAVDAEEPAKSPGYNRGNPFRAPLIANRKLNQPGSEKDTRHFEFDLAGSDLAYEAGDALGVMPANCSELVAELLAALGHSGDETLRDALLRQYEITRISPALLQTMAERTNDELLKKLTAPGVNGELTQFLRGREVIDLLLAHPQVKFEPSEFLGCLKKLQPRLYSISSGPKAQAGQVHLTINVVRYQSLSRHRKGVCSTFLADRSTERVPIYVHQNKNFRMPVDTTAPMIMVGPGTGIAPFRGFLHERRATGATGRNWLFFGDQRSATDFLYRDELENMVREKSLHRLDVAFSRDQAEKIYVQHKMKENAAELFSWLENGGCFYVCGDASRMAKDVEAALLEIIQSAGGRTPEQSVEYLDRLRSEKRYQRDVY